MAVGHSLLPPERLAIPATPAAGADKPAFDLTKDLGSLDSTTRTADQTEAALFWIGPVNPVEFFGAINQIAREVAVDQGNTLVQNARLLALVNLGQADEAIACWEAKFTYNFWRPVTAIRAADTIGNPDTVPDPNWTPLFPTPSHPSYPSGHASFMGGTAAVLASYFGKEIPFSLSYDGLPGVTRNFAGFTAAADECAMARIWAGFHWSVDVTAGDALGRSVGAYIYQNFLVPASPPPGGN